MIKKRIVIDKVAIRYAYEYTPGDMLDYEQLHPYKASVLDGSLGAFGKVWSTKKPPMTKTALPLPSGGTLCVKYGVFANRRWSWVEFNPSTLTSADGAQIEACMSILFTQSMKSLWNRGELFRMDVALDVFGAKFEDYLYVDRLLRSSNQNYQPAGTTYLGSIAGNRSTIIYDKRKEQLAAGKDLGAEPWLRIEARILHPEKWAFHQMGQLPNVFSSLFVVGRKALMESQDPALAPIRVAVDGGHFIDSAFQMLSAEGKRQAWKAFASVTPAWWEPDVDWKGYPGAFDWVHELQ